VLHCDRKCGIVLENDDPSYVSEAIMPLATNQTRHEQMSEAAMRLTDDPSKLELESQGYNWALRAEQFEHALCELIE
jgi:hypothetical protein